MSKDKGAPINRRAFFGAAAGGAAAVTTLGVGGATPAFAQTGDERTRARYQATEHVETFYRVNRYYPRGDN
ncbi:hypothetical protein [Paracoccus tibetensis]|uniref:Formate dehydrogenase region TAT target n=1 Tax=Paracoccus tibetensis TaxID=336292 RepID=A0A1G5I898_9RHOB|nr:hypothetical protein [Paracoccus tibetensis]SCY71900.1 formate dehydrogenase region TAT target [Paracoccus tibetensis]